VPSINPLTLRLLESAYADFHSHYYREKDPISLVHPFPASRDKEVAAFLAALLSYGNVATILGSVRRILVRLGDSPYAAIVDRQFAGRFSDFKHRFTTGDDIEIVCHWVSSALRSHGSLETFFLGDPASRGPSMKEWLSSFVHRFVTQELPAGLEPTRRRRERNLKYLLSDPDRGSACKRLNMFLRWMVRPEDGIDLGLWSGCSPSTLMLPVDTHVLQTLKLLRWTRSQQATWKVVEKATRRLRLYAPQDPIRYDFALCHLSMAGKSIRQYL
jgi:uncharacterized protein (TIGR02757 family)